MRFGSLRSPLAGAGVTTGHIRGTPGREADAPTRVPEDAMDLIEALPVGLMEGVPDFLPASSTGHLTSSGARRRSSRSR